MTGTTGEVTAAPVAASSGHLGGVRVPWRWVLGIWSAPIILGALSSLARSREAAPGGSAVRALWLGAAGWLIWPLLTPVIIHLGQRWPLDRRRHWAIVLVHVVAAAVIGVGAAAVTAIAVYDPAGSRSMIDHVLPRLALYGPMGSTLYVLILGAGYLTINTARLRERELFAERISKELAEAQLSALRMQLQPHFLFNSLNAVMALVRDQATERADRALVVLSDVLRTTLSNGIRPTLPLHEELAFISRYLEIESLRFGDRLTVHYSVPGDLADARVPAFILQPMVENALRHGVMDLPDGGTVWISAQKRGTMLELSVVDDGAGLAPDWEGSARRGVGIANSRARLAHMYGASATLEVSPRADSPGTQACILLPYELVS